MFCKRTNFSSIIKPRVVSVSREGGTVVDEMLTKLWV